MKALILAAGYATRLYPLTRQYPKPLLAVAGRPIIDYIVDKLAAVEEIDEIIVVTNSKFIAKFRKWARRNESGKRLSLVDDLTRSPRDRRGAIGDMYFAVSRKRLKGDLLVIGGDNLFEAGLDEFLSFARCKSPYPVIGVYDIGKKSQAAKYGVVRIDRKARIVDFQEKPPKPQSSLVAMCLYYFPAAKLELVKEYFGARGGKNDATGFYIDWLRHRDKVYAFAFKGRWYDIGQHKFYQEANKQFSRKGEKA